MTSKIILAILIFALLGLLGWLALSKISRKRTSMKKEAQKDYIGDITSKIEKYPKLMGWIEGIAKIIFKTNGKELKSNIAITVGILLGLAILAVLISIFVVMITPLWYLAVLYLAVIFLMTYILLSSILSALNMSFTEKLPAAFKLISSRFTMTGDIIQAIATTVNDSPAVIKKLLRSFVDILAKTDRETIEAQFNDLRLLYDNEYVTILITLVKKAYYSGGAETIREQFEVLSEDIFFEIENEKDVLSGSRPYILFTVFVIPPFLWGVEQFGLYVVEDLLKDYYQSPSGYLLKIVVLLAMSAGIAYMRLQESRRVS